MPGPAPAPGTPAPAAPAPPPAPWTPALARSVHLRHDPVRGLDLLLLPERVVVLRGAAGAVLRLCDGVRDTDAIVAELAARHPGAPVADEVPRFLARIRGEGWLI
ncbi:pyrroloquinoline quinone biosynthesis peptide chaperone PqqD [Streptomyces katsurahamanus]|uniref:Pyrroloquinoline quinone biosynthesis peptide chaperone PqqD n=2 Tax=Streptomyces katsurahamanus TaxID=2577098 RepID=A0ABW9NTB0_9ACTN|nr:pyrroloquinoline quinone biosynthesis peptide chaperone PqqD [Streptomyces katsurahamanus]MQS36304.1 pyrroloquinoline quinone biosynthesis peptide chaperone PqqD [Streptomyces katsurahamanus]